MVCGDMPRKFLIATWEGGGSVGPKLTVARKLIAAGHDVRVMSDACNRLEAEAVGARFVAWSRAPSRSERTRESELVRDWAQPSPADGFKQAIDTMFAGPALAYAEDLMEELARERADLVIASDLLFGAMLGCEAADQDFAVMPCNWLFYPLPGAPRNFPGHRPDIGEAGRAALAEKAKGMRALFDHGLPALNRARTALGLAPLASLVDQLKPARKVLIGISRHFDFATEPDPEGFAYIGPQLDEMPWAEKWQSPFPEGDSRPLVLVSFSTTFQNQATGIQKVIDALEPLPLRAVVTLGPMIEPEDLYPAPNVRLLRSAPHNQVLREASLVVTHGGHGTLARTMAAGLPVLVLPYGRDQDGNGERIVEHGAGLMLSPTASVGDIGEALMRLLVEPGFGEAAARLGEAVRKDIRESRVVEELEGLCCSLVRA